MESTMSLEQQQNIVELLSLIGNSKASSEQTQQHFAALIKSGKLSQTVLQQLKQYLDKVNADRSKTVATGQPAAGPSKSQGSPASGSSSPSVPAPKPGNTEAVLGSQTTNTLLPISATLTPSNNIPVQWPQTRPTLSGGIASGRVSGTPGLIARPEDAGLLSFEENRTRRKSTPGDQSMRRTIQDLVASVDPNVRIEPEVEDLLLSIADEFIDSVTNFACRLAKHRHGDTLEVRDLQLHLERNHNIRIPGFASDETRISLSQSSVTPAPPPPPQKKTTTGTHMTLRSARLAQVQQAKRDAKLL